MTSENFNILFKSLVIIIASIIGIGLGVLTLSGKVIYLVIIIANTLTYAIGVLALSGNGKVI